MNKKRSILLAVLALFSHQAFAENIEARVETEAGVFSGVLTEKIEKAVLFMTDSRMLITIPLEDIVKINFYAEDFDQKKLDEQFLTRNYAELYSELKEKLAYYEEYFFCDSDLSQNFFYLMVSAYWRNDYELVYKIAETLSKSPNQALKDQVEKYINLSKLEQGEIAQAKKFLNSEIGQKLCPPESASNFYINARIKQNAENYVAAIQFASRIISEQAQLSEWVARAELLCLELYFQMEMPESAKSVLRDFKQFYSDPIILNQAAEIAAKNK